MLFLAVLLSAACAISVRFFLKAYYQGDFVRAFWLKGAAALFFIAVGISFLIWRGGSADSSLIACGLILGLVGDQLLAMRLIHRKFHDPFFIAGALSFGVGHVFYMLSLQKTGAVRLWLVIPILIIGVLASLAYARRRGTDVQEKTPLAAGYIVLVLLMASMAVCVAVTTRSVFGILFALGGFLFSLSDNILCAYSFGKDPVWKMNRDLHITYYGAQLAIAWSIFFV